MTINQAALDLIKTSEGFVDHWYPDPGTGGEPWTCAYGHTAAAGPPRYTPGQKFTIAEGETLLRQDLVNTEATVKQLVKVALNENQYGALVSFVFNVGGGNFASSTLLRLLNAGEYSKAAGEFSRWDHAAGKVMPGLITRRAAEMKLFLTPAIADPFPAPIPATPAKPVPPPIPAHQLNPLEKAQMFGTILSLVFRLAPAVSAVEPDFAADLQTIASNPDGQAKLKAFVAAIKDILAVAEALII